jgi:hypothetical protein
VLEARTTDGGRALKGARHTHAVTVYKDGVATDAAATPTVDVYKDDGTQIVTAQNATDVTGTGNYSFTLTTTETANLDILRFVWTGNWGQAGEKVTTYVEVVGGVLFTIGHARALTALENASTYPDADILRMRTVAEQALEDACGVAFVPRYKRETLSGNGLTRLLLSQPKVRTLRSITIDGTAYTVDELADVSTYASRAMYNAAGFTYGTANVVVTYEHGHSYPPGRVSHAALMLAKRWLIDGPIDDRATSMTTEDGTFSLVTPGVRGAYFDLPEVNAVVMEYGRSGLGVS